MLPSPQIRDLTFYRFLSPRRWSLQHSKLSSAASGPALNSPDRTPMALQSTRWFQINKKGRQGVKRPCASAAFSTGCSRRAPPAVRKLCFVFLLLLNHLFHHCVWLASSQCCWCPWSLSLSSSSSARAASCWVPASL